MVSFHVEQGPQFSRETIASNPVQCIVQSMQPSVAKHYGCSQEKRLTTKYCRNPEPNPFPEKHCFSTNQIASALFLPCSAIGTDLCDSSWGEGALCSYLRSSTWLPGMGFEIDAAEQQTQNTRTAFSYQSVSSFSKPHLLSWKQEMATHPYSYFHQSSHPRLHCTHFYFIPAKHFELCATSTPCLHFQEELLTDLEAQGAHEEGNICLINGRVYFSDEKIKLTGMHLCNKRFVL